MDLFEHQAKELFAKYGVAVPRGKVAWSPEEAEAAAAEVGGTVAVKAQVQIGGRGKAGGIQLADNPGRGEPGTGEINYPWLFRHIDSIGYDGWIGCEYKPRSDTVDGLGWRQALTQQK